MTIELFVFPPSPNSFKVMAVANHLGLDYTLRLVDLSKGAHKQPDYAALNPNTLTPTLKEGDFVLWESNAIQQYLASKKPESGLLPEDPAARASVTRWQFWDNAHWGAATMAFTYEYLAKPLMGMGAPDPAALAKGEEMFHRVAKVLDGQLKGNKFVTGDTLTLADFTLGARMNAAEMAHFPVAPYPEINRWFATLQKLPAWQKTLSQSKL